MCAAPGPDLGLTSPSAACDRSLRDPVLGLAMAIQAGLTLPAIGANPLWLDEAFSAVIAARPFSEMPRALENDAGPPLYYALLRLWRGLLSDSEASLRALSLLFALATTVLLYRLALSLLDRRTARIAALLWATHPLVAFYAGETRNYTLFAFLSVLLLATVSASPQWRGRAPAIGALVLALGLTHNLGWMAVAAALAAAVVTKRPGAIDRRVGLALTAAVLAYLPWVPVLRSQFANTEKTISWMQTFWTPWTPLLGLAAFVPFGKHLPLISLPSAPGSWWIAATIPWMAAAGAALWIARTGPRAQWVRFLGAFMVFGLILPTVWSALRMPVVLPGRTDFFVLPAFILLVASGLAALPARLALSATLVLLSTAVMATAAEAGQSSGLDEREWIEPLRRWLRPSDVVVCSSLTRPAAEYYLRGAGPKILSFPQDMAIELAHFDERWYWRHLDVEREGSLVASAALDAVGERGTIWVVSSDHLLNAALMKALERLPGFTVSHRLRSPRMGLRRIEMPVSLVGFSRGQAKPDTALPASP
jgi:hypothetical protein